MSERSLTRRSLCGLLAAAPLGFAARAAAADAVDGTAIFAKAKSTFRAHSRPEFVVYTLDRTETVDGAPAPDDTYRLRIWYRSADRAAMSRRLTGKTATGPLQFLHVAFNQATDPGPPTTDVFEPVPPRGGVLPTPEPRADLRTIQTVKVAGELDYRVVSAEIAGDAYHLTLEPLRDPDRNRLRQLWVDAQSYEVRRAIATDRLYFYGDSNGWVPDMFDMTLQLQGGIPVIERIASTTEVDAETQAHGPHIINQYVFEDIAFPETLPSWYFHPEEYGPHASEAPGY